MRVLRILSPKLLIHFAAGHEPGGEASGHAALHGLNDHYLRDIGLRRERPDRLLYPWLM